MKVVRVSNNRASDEIEKYKLSKPFSISYDAAKQLEIAITKKRNKAHHKCDRFFAWLYSLYLILVKQ